MSFTVRSWSELSITLLLKCLMKEVAEILGRNEKTVSEYFSFNELHHIIKQYSAINIRNKFEAKPIIECSIESHKIPSFIDDLIQHSAGTVETVILKKNVLIDVSPS